MSEKSILSQNQKDILAVISKDKLICDNFYLTGGTALAEFYLRHRLSEDLDFFAENEFEPQGISIFLEKVKGIAKIKKVEYQQSFNRNLFFLDLVDGDKIKMEFTYFPFARIEKKEKIGFDQIIKHIERAVLDLKAAEANLAIDLVVSYNCSYSAMLKAGRALMFLFGCRPSDGQQHKTVVLFSEKALGTEFSNLTSKFDKMRGLRNKFTYDEPEIQVSESEAKDASITAILKEQNCVTPCICGIENV